MEPKDTVDNTAPSTQKQDDVMQNSASTAPSQEVNVDFNQGAPTAPAPQNPNQIGTPVDTNAGNSPVAAASNIQSTNDAMPSLASEAPADQFAAMPAAPIDPAEGAPMPGDPGQPGSTDRLGAVGDSTQTGINDASQPSPMVNAPQPQNITPVTPPTDFQPQQAPISDPLQSTAPTPVHDNNKTMFVLIGIAVIIIAAIAVIMFI